MAKELQLPVFGGKAKEVVSVPRDMFGLPWNDMLIAQYVRVYLANQARNLSLGKTRSNVQGSTRKIYKQKGTGRARHGDIKAPVFVGGGLAHGPKNESPRLEMNKKMKRKSLFVALSKLMKEKHINVIADAALSQAKKTKDASTVVAKLMGENSKKILLVTPHSSEAKRQYTNLTNVTVTEVSGMNAYMLLNHKQVVLTPAVIEEMKVQFSPKEAPKA
ncbi:MAG: 50S ribosomal protein L4 [Candidatus Roizmanbacteria bacterium]|nr:50S ribosomal protein L4 [Candidatus Roizmanbacteria bacterium]